PLSDKVILPVIKKGNLFESQLFLMKLNSDPCS
ncbi:MAG: hypothetical protein ACI86M_002078, partial [Saprospiraceae bacterium]